MRREHVYVLPSTVHTAVSSMYTHVRTYVCMYVHVLYLLVKVLAEAVLQHCIEGCDGLRFELKAHNGAHLWGEWPGGRGVSKVSGRVG